MASSDSYNDRDVLTEVSNTFQNTHIPSIRLKAMPDPNPNIQPKPFDVKFKGDLSALQAKVMEGKILEQAANQLKNTPGFNPAALSVVFGLKW